MKRNFWYAGVLLATFSPTQPNIIVLAGAALGVGVYFFDVHMGQVRVHLRLWLVLHHVLVSDIYTSAGGAKVCGYGPGCDCALSVAFWLPYNDWYD